MNRSRQHLAGSRHFAARSPLSRRAAAYNAYAKLSDVPESWLRQPKEVHFRSILDVMNIRAALAVRSLNLDGLGHQIRQYDPHDPPLFASVGEIAVGSGPEFQV